MELLWRHADYTSWMQEHGLVRFEDFMGLNQGVVVRRRQNGSRSVTRLRIGSVTTYLKREFRIAHKEKFRNWWDGFGAVGKSLREWRMLHRVRQAGFLTPLPLACGQRGSQAFLLTAELEDCLPLDKYMQGASARELQCLAVRLACWLARFHAAGLANPDLYSWHIHVRVTDQEIAVLDLARAWQGESIPWRERIRELAVLALSLPAELRLARDCPEFLQHYLLVADLSPLPAPHSPFATRYSPFAVHRRWLWRAVRREMGYFHSTMVKKRQRRQPPQEHGLFQTA